MHALEEGANGIIYLFQRYNRGEGSDKVLSKTKIASCLVFKWFEKEIEMNKNGRKRGKKKREDKHKTKKKSLS